MLNSRRRRLGAHAHRVSPSVATFNEKNVNYNSHSHASTYEANSGFTFNKNPTTVLGDVCTASNIVEDSLGMGFGGWTNSSKSTLRKIKLNGAISNRAKQTSSSAGLGNLIPDLGASLTYTNFNHQAEAMQCRTA